MKKLVGIFLSLFILMLFIPTSEAKTFPEVGKITFYVGTVEVKAGNGDWLTADSLNYVIRQNMKIRTTSDSKAEITLSNNTIVRLDEKTEVDMKNCFPAEEKKSSKIVLTLGNLWANMTRLTQTRSNFETESPTAVAAVRGTIYNMSYNESDTTSTVAVHEGKVDVVPAKKKSKESGVPQGWGAPKEVGPPKVVSLDEWITILANQKVTIGWSGWYERADFDPEEEAKDEWVKFNLDRDAELKDDE